MKLMKAMKRPIEIECYQLTKEARDFIAEWCNCLTWFSVSPGMRDRYFIDTLEGKHECSEGDYILKGIKGEFYPCRKDIFEESYIVYEDDYCLSSIKLNLKEWE